LEAVERGLTWLAASQAEDGSWSDGSTEPAHKVAATGLAVRAFLCHGYTNRGKHPYARVVSLGLRYLKNAQQPGGCFAPEGASDAWAAHAVASFAMGSVYDMTHSPIFRGALQKSLDAIVLHAADGPWGASWNDATLEVLLALPLAAATATNREAEARGRPAPLPVDPATVAALVAWTVAADDDSLALRAGKLRVRALLGEDASKGTPLAQAIAVLGKERPPRAGVDLGLLDLALGLDALRTPYRRHVGRWTDWLGWHRAARALAGDQRRDDAGPLAGSWEPRGGARFGGGRVVATAIAACAIAPHGHVSWGSPGTGARFGY
jgi:hypothetical protein